MLININSFLSRSAGERLDRRVLSKAFFWHEIQEEIKERHVDWVFTGKTEESKDQFLDYVENCRRKELYVHNEDDCSSLCKEKGTIRGLSGNVMAF